VLLAAETSTKKLELAVGIREQDGLLEDGDLVRSKGDLGDLKSVDVLVNVEDELSAVSEIEELVEDNDGGEVKVRDSDGVDGDVDVLLLAKSTKNPRILFLAVLPIVEAQLTTTFVTPGETLIEGGEVKEAST
jgi:hypothetical protein